MRHPIPPGNGTRPRNVKLRWLEQADRMLRGLWWVEQIACDKTCDEKIDGKHIRDLKAALLDAVAVLEEREARDARRAKIEHLARVEGRTPEETAIYLAKARQMREKAS